MFGISWSEFFVILLVAVVVVPARLWPDVARFVARAIKWVRQIIWKITDASAEITKQIDLEKPIDEILQTTTNQFLDEISVPLSRRPKNKKSNIRGRRKK